MGVVTGQHRVSCSARAFVHLVDLGLGRPDALTAEQFENPLRRVRQEGRQQGIGVRDDLQSDVQHRVATVGVVLQLPGFGLRQVLIGRTHHPHRLGDRLLELTLLQQRADRVEGSLAVLEQFDVDRQQFVSRRNGAVVLVGHRNRAVHEVAPLVGQLGVVATDELVPGEVGVAGFGAGHRDVVAQGVGSEFTQEVADVDDVPVGGVDL
ncbi:hypothetical protein SDC9_120020 [bioreactor metagenome]|uniref:Uncharacterized protein n=1 Tax=bioreactor metagenome TaxID=1076179 RepID=A0A645C9L8_9ZZZZ